MFTSRFIGLLRIGSPLSVHTRSSTAAITRLATYSAPVQGLKPYRYSSSSSSKPSNPSDGRSRTSITGTTGVRRTSRSGLRGSAGGAAGGAKVPVVPSTDHLHPADVAVSAFFAQHRPVSISYPVPMTHSSNLFDSIFTPPQGPSASATSRSSAVSPSRTATVYHASPVASDFETVDTTGSSPTTFEAAVRSAHNPSHQHHHHHRHNHYRKQSPPSPPEEAEGEPSSEATAATTTTSTSTSTSTSAPDYTTYYKPFRPPPAPRAQTAFLRPRLRKQFIELFLRIAASHPSPGTTVAISGNSKLLLQSMMGPRGESAGAMNGQERIFMRLISVKRIRKLKMKKHKLRKLRKRTRSLRRRVESQRK